MTEAPRHPIKIGLEKCIGCVHCLTACPTKAIRIKNGKALILSDLCIDSGEYIRFCPHDAVESQTTSFTDLDTFRFKVAIPATVLFRPRSLFFRK